YRRDNVAVPVLAALTVHVIVLPTALVRLQKPVPLNPVWLLSVVPWHTPFSASYLTAAAAGAAPPVAAFATTAVIAPAAASAATAATGAVRRIRRLIPDLQRRQRPASFLLGNLRHRMRTRIDLTQCGSRVAVAVFRAPEIRQPVGLVIGTPALVGGRVTARR